jgi:hypothetical protein
MGSVEKAARQLYASQKADGRIPKAHPQREDLEKKQQTYEQDFNSTALSLFDKVLFPIQRADRPPQLANKALDVTRDTSKPFDGEAQVEKTLTSNPIKLYLDVEKDFDPIRDKAQDLLWPENQDEARWSDIADRYSEQAGMPWLPPKGLDTLKAIRLQPRPLGRSRQRLRDEEAQEQEDFRTGDYRVRAQRLGRGAPTHQPTKCRPRASSSLRP